MALHCYECDYWHSNTPLEEILQFYLWTLPSFIVYLWGWKTCWDMKVKSRHTGLSVQWGSVCDWIYLSPWNNSSVQSLQNEVDSWHLHFVANTHPCTLNEHISWEQFTHLWGQRMYPTYLVDANNSLCMLCHNIFWAVQQCLHSEHDKVFLYRLITSCSAVLWNKHVPLWPLWCSLLFTPLCHSSIHRADLWWLPHSCLFFSLLPQQFTKQ